VPPFTIVPQTAAQLTAATTPTSGTDLEAVPWDLFDTNVTAFANAAGPLNVPFYQTVQTDPTLGNMQMPGALPAPQWLEPAALAVDILSVPSTGAALQGALSDHANILKTNTAAFNMKVSQKDYGTFPLMLAHSIGGEIGIISSTVATSSQQYANNGVADGGWWMDGAIVIPSQQNFIVSILTKQGATLTLQLSPTPVRTNLWGVLHRRVL
jgi:hypothetical protein